MSIVHIRTNPDGDEVQFRPDAAASFRRVEHQAGREVNVGRTVVAYEVQADLYAQYLRGEYPYTVAPPDYSNHVYRADNDGGNAWDTEERGEWLDENGWIADIKDEPWHREYRAWLDQHINDPDPATPTPTTGDPEMFLFYAGTLTPSNAMLATYDGRKLKCRPTVGTEAIALIAALPAIPRVQLSAEQVVDLASQGGYVWDAENGVGLYDGVPSYWP